MLSANCMAGSRQGAGEVEMNKTYTLSIRIPVSGKSTSHLLKGLGDLTGEVTLEEESHQMNKGRDILGSGEANGTSEHGVLIECKELHGTRIGR